MVLKLERMGSDDKQLGGQTCLSRDIIVRAVEEDIMTGRLKPGEKLDERVLAERFGVSRTPVRDAIGRLASIGLVEVKPRSGTYVARLDVSDLFQVFEFMADMEGLCAFYAARRMGAAEQDELKRLTELCLETVLTEPGNYSSANFAYHDLIYRSCGNEYLESVTRQARGRVGGHRDYTFTLPGRMARSAEEHVEITGAILAGDPDRARLLMMEHVNIRRTDFAPFLSLISAR